MDQKSFFGYSLLVLILALFVGPFVWEWVALVLDSAYAFSIVFSFVWRFQDWLWSQAAVILVQLSLIFDNKHIVTAFWNVVMFYWNNITSWRNFFISYENEADESGTPNTVRIGTTILVILVISLSALVPKIRNMWIRAYNFIAQF